MHESAFVKAFGSSPKIKVIDFLLDNRVLDWSKSDMAEHTGISRNTLDNFFHELVSGGIIVGNRKIGRATLYRLKANSGLVQRLIALDEYLSGLRRPSKKQRQIAAKPAIRKI